MNEDVEMYLMQIARQLRGLPTRQRESELREIESHLRAMIEAREVGGVLYSEAVSASLQQFGSPQRVGRELTRTWRQHQPESLGRNLVAALTAVACQIGVEVSVSFTQFSIFKNAIENGDDLAAVALLSRGIFFGVTCGVAPFIGGYLASRIAPRRGWWVAYGAYALLFSVFFLFYGVHTPYPLRRIIDMLLGPLPALLGGAWLSAHIKEREVKGRQPLPQVLQP